MPTSDLLDIKELKELYTTYLKALSPDWSHQRICAEVEAVFAEQGLDQSEQRRRDFQHNLIRKLETIKKHPDDWFFRENGYRR